jgi:leucine dehydrogenase
MGERGIPAGLLEQADAMGVQEVHVRVDADSGLKAIVGIHSLRLGPALGGARCVPYADSGAALYDALRLARGMSYKAAISRLPYGGGKAVIMRPREISDRKGFYRAFGDFIESLGGRYVTAMDSGTEVSDMDIIAERTRFVACTTARGGDPAPFTALGVFSALKATVEFRLGRDDLDGLHVALQGAGHVGYQFARRLHDAGAKLTVTDREPARAQRCAQEFGARVVGPDEIYTVDADVFAPCALGAVLNEHTIPQLRAKVVVGAANNQLATPADGVALAGRDITYAPDYVANAGGLIQIALSERDAATIDERVRGIYDTLLEVFARARRGDCTPETMANRMAEAILAGEPMTD